MALGRIGFYFTSMLSWSARHGAYGASGCLSGRRPHVLPGKICCSQPYANVPGPPTPYGALRMYVQGGCGARPPPTLLTSSTPWNHQERKPEQQHVDCTRQERKSLVLPGIPSGPK